jgi:hypothetical protein
MHALTRIAVVVARSSSTCSRVLSALESRWTQSVAALSGQERETLFRAVPPLEEHYCGGRENRLSGS